MQNVSRIFRPYRIARPCFFTTRKWFAFCLLLLMTLGLRAQPALDPEDRYMGIFSMIEQADALSASGKTGEALKEYLAAQAALTQLKRENPTWNAKTVSFRLSYLSDKIAATSVKTNTSPAGAEISGPAAHSEARSTASQVKLLDAGAEPRRTLRLHPSPGDKQTIIATIKTGMTMDMGQQAAPSIKLPGMQLTMDVTVNNIAANGDINFGLLFSDISVVNDADVMPQVAELMKNSLNGLRGLSGTGTLSDHGINKGTEVPTPAKTDPQAAQTFDQMKETLSNLAIPLPDEPVGSGAKWEYRTKMKSQGMSISQTTTYELVSAEDEHLALRAGITQNAANQQIENPAMPGLKVNVTKMNGSGTGNSTLDLSRLMPLSCNMTQKTDLVMALNLGQQKQSMSMKMDLDVQLTSK